MIPGNTPEDVEWDSLYDWIAELGMEPSEVRALLSAPEPAETGGEPAYTGDGTETLEGWVAPYSEGLWTFEEGEADPHPTMIRARLVLRGGATAAASEPADEAHCPICGHGTEPCAPDWCYRCEKPIAPTAAEPERAWTDKDMEANAAIAVAAVTQHYETGVLDLVETSQRVSKMYTAGTDLGGVPFEAAINRMTEARIRLKMTAPLRAIATLPAEPEPEAPTPEKLRAMAEWFDDPANPGVDVVVGFMTPGHLLRRIADAQERLATPEAEGGSP
jgi:hypothetical protein